MAIRLRKSLLVGPLACLLIASRAWAENPTPEKALSFQPVQTDVQIDRPERAEIAKCTVKDFKIGNRSGWIVREPGGMILRVFVDTNGDNTVDQWNYYKDGIEVYRDIDSNFNRKADQYRWLNTAGSRWGIDTDENGKIDFWKNISAEETSAELVAALRDRDKARFERLLLSDKELKTLGLGGAKADQLQKMLATASADFIKLANSQKVVGPQTKWTSFGGTQPGIVPAGSEDSSADLLVYENVAAMIDTEGKPQAITIGTMVKVKDIWRLIGAPQVVEDATAAVEPKTFFFAVPRSEHNTDQIAKPNEKIQKLLKELNDLGDITPQTPPPHHNRRAQLLLALVQEADSPEMRAQWYRQLADSLSAAVQTGTYAEGVQQLKDLVAELEKEPQDAELAAYTQFRFLTAEHGQALSKPDANFAQIQEQWMKDLEAFIEKYHQLPDTADAMMELAIAYEFAGNDEKAIKWYESLVKEFPDSPRKPMAAGAKLRLTSVGNPIPLAAGKFNLVQLANKVVLIQYWATWCEPCLSDMPLMKDLWAKYGKHGFEIVGVNLDNDKKEMNEFLKENNLPWPQLHEPGGLNSPLAVQLGIQSLPTMILVDKGKVVNRNIRATELKGELQKLLQNAAANKTSTNAKKMK